jgi:hypothetical protein
MTKKRSKRRINGEGSVYQRKSDGRWVGQFTDHTIPGGRYRYVYAKTRRRTRRTVSSGWGPLPSKPSRSIGSARVSR